MLSTSSPKPTYEINQLIIIAIFKHFQISQLNLTLAIISKAAWLTSLKTVTTVLPSANVLSLSIKLSHFVLKSAKYSSKGFRWNAEFNRSRLFFQRELSTSVIRPRPKYRSLYGKPTFSYICWIFGWLSIINKSFYKEKNQ